MLQKWVWIFNEESKIVHDGLCVVNENMVEVHAVDIHGVEETFTENR